MNICTIFGGKNAEPGQKKDRQTMEIEKKNNFFWPDLIFVCICALKKV